MVVSADAVGFIERSDEIEVVTTTRWSVHHHDVDTGQESEYVEIPGRNPAGQAPDSLPTPAVITDQLIATSISGGDVDLIRGDEHGVLSPQLAETFDLAPSPDNTRLAIAGDEGVALLSLNGDRLLGRAVQTSDSASDLNVTTDGRFVVASVATADGAKELWRIDDDAVHRVPILGPEPGFIHNNGVGSTIITVDLNARGHRLLDPETGRQGDLFGPENSWIGAASPSESLVALADFEGRVHVHRVSDLSLIATFHELATGAESIIRSLTFDSRDRYLAATTDFGAAVVWKLETGEPLELPAIVEIGFGPDGEFAATVGRDGSVTFRTIPGFQPSGQTLLGSTSSENVTYGPFFTPDGRYMVSTIDGSGRIWDLATGLQIGGVFPSEGAANASIDARWLMT